MDSTVNFIQLIFALLGHLRPELTENLELLGLSPDFTVAWVITWFAHVVPKTADVLRLFDLFLATDPLMLIYLSVAVMHPLFSNGLSLILHNANMAVGSPRNRAIDYVVDGLNATTPVRA